MRITLFVACLVVVAALIVCQPDDAEAHTLHVHRWQHCADGTHYVHAHAGRSGGRDYYAGCESGARVTARASRSSAPATGDAVWHRLRACEAPDWSGGWRANTGNGYYGGLQFDLRTWRSVGGSGYPHLASVGEQIARGKALHARRGWAPWPTCSRKLGLR